MRLELKTAPASVAIERQDVKDHDFINNNTMFDTQIDSKMVACTLELERLMGRCFINQSWYIYLDRDEYYDKLIAYKNTITLSTLNVSSITEVTKYQMDNTTSVVTSSNYRLSGNETTPTSKLAFNDDTPPTYENLRMVDAVRIEVVAGYGAAKTDIPKPVFNALATLCAHRVAFPQMAGKEDIKTLMQNLHPEIFSYRSVEAYF